MNPLDFLETAEALAGEIGFDDEPTEADLRSATSRAYYAAFLHARDLLEQITQQRVGEHEAHKCLPELLVAAGVENLVRAGKDLGVLRLERNSADYETRTTYSGERVTVGLKRARSILQRIDAVVRSPAESEAARTAVARYVGSVPVLCFETTR